MNNLNALTSFALFLNVFLSLNSALSEDSIALVSSNWKESMDKRNTWWTKKSVPEEELQLDITDKESSLYITVLSSVGCYINSCIPSFLQCCHSAEIKQNFLRCKQLHRRCIMNCFKE
ncbi:uncharacterized protein LOC111638670 isoform X1 [Centruroides sculpturatus]|uniref:uncharacterized protein LOC111638670 isoform X1 n=1 Tax=Centruroides sculpturatus TaxID=218467 RepID=UPI000C6DA061|nr:uncharacterized protein LOC111638670 isoform X1 [Centruroides sculpturatus]XP_023240183.1 uncharacterized protein LOC111638670 isoform X1 [Centruroides sculpturatus]XP_023240184.1 uncharacterized protein LOC111638670 isoform X1 [Centruroides sculpturatus]